jgi:hypothetical protein
MEASPDASELEKDPADSAQFSALPDEAGKAASYKSWQRDFVNWLYGAQSLELFRSPSLQEISQPGETERDFRVRLHQAAREERDRRAEQLRRKYAPKKDALEEKIRRSEQALAREQEQAKQQKVQTAISIGATLLGAFLGRKAVGVGTVGRATTAARSYSRTQKEAQDVARAEENIDVLKQRMEELQAQFDSEIRELESAISPMTEALETISIKPKKTNISVRLLSLAWAPFWLDPQGNATAGWQ